MVISREEMTENITIVDPALIRKMLEKYKDPLDCVYIDVDSCRVGIHKKNINGTEENIKIYFNNLCVNFLNTCDEKKIPFELFPLIIIVDEETYRPFSVMNINPFKVFIRLTLPGYTAFMLFHELAHCWLNLKGKHERNDYIADLIAMIVLKKIIPSDTEEYKNIIRASYIGSDYGKEKIGEEFQKNILNDPEGSWEEISSMT